MKERCREITEACVAGQARPFSLRTPTLGRIQGQHNSLRGNGVQYVLGRRSQTLRYLVPMALILAAVTAASAQRAGAFSASRGHPAIAYNSSPVDTIITALNARLERGELTLAFDPVRGYL